MKWLSLIPIAFITWLMLIILKNACKALKVIGGIIGVGMIIAILIFAFF